MIKDLVNLRLLSTHFEIYSFISPLLFVGGGLDFDFMLLPQPTSQFLFFLLHFLPFPLPPPLLPFYKCPEGKFILETPTSLPLTSRLIIKTTPLGALQSGGIYNNILVLCFISMATESSNWPAASLDLNANPLRLFDDSPVRHDEDL